MSLVIGHRGASRDHPENTLAAFVGAREQGADWVELDVRRTLDGALVVHHDPHLADGRPIAETLAASLPDQVCTLAEALEACAPMGVNIEIKNDPNEPGFDPTDALAAEVLAVAAAAGVGSELLVSCFHLPTVEAVRRLRPDMPTGYLVLDPTTPVDAVQVAVEGGHAAVHPWNPCVTEAAVAAARAAGVALNVWTVDDPARIIELAGWGVDGIITNRPALALEALGRS